MRHEISEPHFLETTQQDIRSLLPDTSDELSYALDRSCTPHCVEAIAELCGLHIPSFEHLDTYVQFLREHGAHPGRSESELYNVNDGWYNVAVADLLRVNQYEVVLQRLQYDSDTTDLQAAKKVGRARSTDEIHRLDHLKMYGGDQTLQWMRAIEDTLGKDGYVIASIKIPSSKVEGEWGQHSVVVLAVDDETVTYFDPDKLLLDRYRQDADQQAITRQDDSKLVYTQEVNRFLQRMTGEVIHIFQPEARTTVSTQASYAGA